MNERLKQLMLKAGYAAPEIAGRAHKLAILVARECIEIVAREANQYEAPTWAYEIVNDIDETFGVEP